MRVLSRITRTLVIGAAIIAATATPAGAAPFPGAPGSPSIQPPSATCFKFPYFGPKGHANFDFGQDIVRLLDERGIRVEGLAPMQAKPGNRGIYMPIGWKQDHIDPCNGVYYPGGFAINDVRSGHRAAIHDIYLRPDGAHAQVEIDGEPQGEQLVATYRLSEFAPYVPTPRPLEGGIGPKHWPFYVSPYLSRTVRQLTGIPLNEGAYLANLDAVVQYVP
ncbi:hypothetical protein E1267_10505 [Nonomuraea longispora]|uniref:Uncharacterized protein n=1 Tax=Nonomuraea longispora TaxID=1848320 RepID=A0A4R4NIN5_9ACTN|nr:hypothetical protein [Nonomuraea longispora]TDC08434.1 hypothetical protein E1267_10505 [Nonomuraea longispora]